LRRDDATPVDEQHRRFPTVPQWGHVEHKSPHPTAARLAFYHYTTKSEEDFAVKSAVKSARGGGGAGRKMWSFFVAVQKSQTHHPMCEEPSKLADLCCPLPAGRQAEAEPFWYTWSRTSWAKLVTRRFTH